MKIIDYTLLDNTQFLSNSIYPSIARLYWLGMGINNIWQPILWQRLEYQTHNKTTYFLLDL